MDVVDAGTTLAKLAITCTCFRAWRYLSLSSSTGRSTRSCILRCNERGPRRPARIADRSEKPSYNSNSPLGTTISTAAADPDA